MGSSARQYTLTVEYDLSAVPEADKQGLLDMIEWLQAHKVEDGTDIKASRILQSFRYFTMPYDDVTATVTWVPVGGSADEIQTAKDSALTAVKTALDSYGTEHPQYGQILAAYETGVGEIENAGTVEAVGTARKDALKAMANVANSVTTGQAIEDWAYGIGTYWGN